MCLPFGVPLASLDKRGLPAPEVDCMSRNGDARRCVRTPSFSTYRCGLCCRARRGFGSSLFPPRSHLMDVSEPHAPPPGANNEHGMLSLISNEMVRIYKSQFGRGPTKTRTQWAGPDILVVTLEKTLTPAEHSLRRLGEHGRLRDLRMLFQYA